MQKKWWCLLVVFFSSLSLLWAQQKPLPDFFIHRGNQNAVVISWVNNFGDECIQLNVQRSYDSLTNFKTLFSTPAPQLPTNGYTDRNAPPGRVFYRIFYMLNSGAYFFTTVKKPEDITTASEGNGSNAASSMLINPVVMGNSMVSKNRTGNILVTLRTPDVYNYKMVIYNQQGNKTLYTIKRFPDATLILDKGTFLRKGRYRFQIWYNGQVKETGYMDVD
ncbi:MAG: hypothetical protein QM610_07530 [Chitinophagaceae bacterium]